MEFIGGARRAEPKDFLPIASLRARAWQAAYRGIVPQAHLDAMSEPSTLTERAELMSASRRVRTYVGMRGGLVSGFVGVGSSPDTSPRSESCGPCTSTLTSGAKAWVVR